MPLGDNLNGSPEKNKIGLGEDGFQGEECGEFQTPEKNLVIDVFASKNDGI